MSYEGSRIRLDSISSAVTSCSLFQTRYRHQSIHVGACIHDPHRACSVRLEALYIWLVCLCFRLHLTTTKKNEVIGTHKDLCKNSIAEDSFP